MAERPKAPLEGTPGDLRMILRFAVEQLDEIERSEPANADRVDACALTVIEALEDWAEKRKERALRYGASR